MVFLVFFLSVFSPIGFRGMISPITYIAAVQLIHVTTPVYAAGFAAEMPFLFNAANTISRAADTSAGASDTAAYAADTAGATLNNPSMPWPTLPTNNASGTNNRANTSNTKATPLVAESDVNKAALTLVPPALSSEERCKKEYREGWPGWNKNSGKWDNPNLLNNLLDFCSQRENLIKNLERNCISELKEFKEITPLNTPAYETAKKQYNYCKEKWDEILNTEYGKRDCREQVKKKYDTAEAWEKDKPNDERDKPSKEQKDLKKAAENAEKKLKACKEENGYTKNERCREAARDLRSVTQDFNKSCGELGGDADSCIRSLKSCSECDNPSEGASLDDIDCVSFRQTGICPELATGLLEDLKEEKEDFEEKTKDLEEKLEALKEDKSRLEAELSDEKLAFEADIEELRAKEEELKEELEVNFKSIKAEIKAAFEAARAKMLAEIDKSDQLQYQLSNSIEEAHRKYRRERQKIYKGCEIQAKEKLSEYRKARKTAIAEGRFRRESISQALSENRVTFAQKDDKKFSGYYTSCIKETRHLVDALREDLQFELRKIEQQKQMLIKQLESMKSQMQALANEAKAKEQTTVSDYITQLSKIAEKIQKGVDSRTNVYTQKSFQLGRQITRKAAEIMQTEAILRETQNKFNHNQEMRNRLRAAGASDEDKSSQLADASSDHNNLIEEWDNAFQICNCKPGNFTRDEEARECKQIKRAGKLAEPDHENLQNSSRSKSDRDDSSGSE